MLYFGYLRQSLLCLSDATIERPRPGQYDGGKAFIDGVGEKAVETGTFYTERR